MKGVPDQESSHVIGLEAFFRLYRLWPWRMGDNPPALAVILFESLCSFQPLDLKEWIDKNLKETSQKTRWFQGKISNFEDIRQRKQPFLGGSEVMRGASFSSLFLTWSWCASASWITSKRVKSSLYLKQRAATMHDKGSRKKKEIESFPDLNVSCKFFHLFQRIDG